MPPRLLLLDAPDVDSDAPVNWQRARAIRQAADVLVAVLTQQKYNDAAVKQFFREAARADKPIIVVFNQCDLEADREYWPLWLATFCEETGAGRSWFTSLPYDRRAAESAATAVLSRWGPTAANRSMGRSTSATSWPRCASTPSRFAPSAGPLARVLDRGDAAPPAYLQAIAAAAGAVRRRGRRARRPRKWPASPGPRCPPAPWSTRSAAWWDAGRSPGRGRSTASTAWWAAG